MQYTEQFAQHMTEYICSLMRLSNGMLQRVKQNVIREHFPKHLASSVTQRMRSVTQRMRASLAVNTGKEQALRALDITSCGR